MHTQETREGSRRGVRPKEAAVIVTISKAFDFDAAHWLPGVPEGHKCGKMHGHTYRVEVQLRGSTGVASGWLLDYADVAAAWKPLHAKLDHKVLNDVFGLENPTTEILAWWILAHLGVAPETKGLVHAVRVYESSTTWCEAVASDRNADAKVIK